MESSENSCRVLSPEERSKLEEDTSVVSDFKRNKLEIDAARNWDLFYKRNETKFFKDRHWTHSEFTNLLPDVHFQSPQVLLEVGCGVGNLLYPLLAYFPTWTSYACDFSPRAVQFVKSHSDYCESKVTAFVCDITVESGVTSLAENCTQNSIHLCTMIFVLSAISPHKMISAISNVHKCLKSGGRIIVRDYGLFDHAMLRFKKGHKIDQSFYWRQDGTRAFYFSLDKLKSLFESVGMESERIEYIHKTTTNIKQEINVPRVFVQAVFVKK